MIKQRKIELLAPAKNLECGIEAINHGADAVYIGAPKFGARAAAVNSLEDIAALVQYAHLYNARIYVTVNTILKEEMCIRDRIKGKEYDCTARSGKRIGFYVDKRFLDGYKGKMAIKLTYYDKTDFNICYYTPKGRMTYHVEGTGSDKEMTVTLIVEDMVKAPQEGFDPVSYTHLGYLYLCRLGYSYMAYCF